MKDDAVHTETRKGLTIKLYQDENAQSPDEWGNDNLLLVHYHRNFDVRQDKMITEDDARAWYQGEKIEQEKAYHIFPVAAYIHSGVVLKLGEGRDFPDYQWDVSHVGLVLVAKGEWKTKAKALKAAESLVKEWNQYLAGEVYGYVVEDAKGANLDSCWGFYGYDYALEEARSIADCNAKEIARKHTEKLKAQIKHNVPLERRIA
jgi:hypothetical protein